MFKKMLIASCGLLCVAAALSAQVYEVGDPMVKDDVPCIVISVDESGQHGVAMSCIPTQRAFKNAKKTGDYKWFWHTGRMQKMKGKEKKLMQQYRMEYYNAYKRDTVHTRTSSITCVDKLSTSVNGKENMQDVMAFCYEKEISMERYFPEFYWAQTLGDDWFVAGVAEMEMLIKLMGYEGLGFEFAHGMRQQFAEDKEQRVNRSENTAKLDAMSQYFSEQQDLVLNKDFILPAVRLQLETSTWTNDGKKTSIPLFLVPMTRQIDLKEWYDMLLGRFPKLASYLCVCFEF